MTDLGDRCGCDLSVTGHTLPLLLESLSLGLLPLGRFSALIGPTSLHLAEFDVVLAIRRVGRVGACELSSDPLAQADGSRADDRLVVDVVFHRERPRLARGDDGHVRASLTEDGEHVEQGLVLSNRRKVRVERDLHDGCRI
jgi:hypothetical protein